MPLIYHHKPTPHTDVAVWKITESPGELKAMLQLSKGEERIIDEMLSSVRYRHWLGSRVLIRLLMNTDRFIELSSNEKRKPEIANFPHRVSLSHSGEMAAVILSKNREVGVDIEELGDKVLRIKQRFLSEEELNSIHPETVAEQSLLAWCAKEALFKLYAKGKVSFRNDLPVDLSDEFREEGVVPAQIIKPDHNRRYQVHYRLLEGYLLAWVIGHS